MKSIKKIIFAVTVMAVAMGFISCKPEPEVQEVIYENVGGTITFKGGTFTIATSSISKSGEYNGNPAKDETVTLSVKGVKVFEAKISGNNLDLYTVAGIKTLTFTRKK